MKWKNVMEYNMLTWNKRIWISKPPARPAKRCIPICRSDLLDSSAGKKHTHKSMNTITVMSKINNARNSSAQMKGDIWDILLPSQTIKSTRSAYIICPTYVRKNILGYVNKSVSIFSEKVRNKSFKIKWTVWSIVHSRHPSIRAVVRSCSFGMYTSYWYEKNH